MRTYIAALAIAASTAPALALDQGELNDMAARCLAAVDAGEMLEAKAIAAQFAEMEGRVIFNPARWQGAKCLTLTTEQDWVFTPDENRFVTKDVYDGARLLAQLERDNDTRMKNAARKAIDLMQKAEAQKVAAAQLVDEAKTAYEDALRDRVQAQTLVACNALYGRDQHAALLSPVCHPLFVANGLPDD